VTKTKSYRNVYKIKAFWQRPEPEQQAIQSSSCNPINSTDYKIKSLVATLSSEEGYVPIELYTHIHLDTD